MGFDIKTATTAKGKLEAKIGKKTSDIAVSAGKIQTGDAELKAATGVRAKEAADFAAAEKELADGSNFLGRRLDILSAKGQKVIWASLRLLQSWRLQAWRVRTGPN